MLQWQKHTVHFPVKGRSEVSISTRTEGVEAALRTAKTRWCQQHVFRHRHDSSRWQQLGSQSCELYYTQSYSGNRKINKHIPGFLILSNRKVYKSQMETRNDNEGNAMQFRVSHIEQLREDKQIKPLLNSNKSLKIQQNTAKELQRKYRCLCLPFSTELPLPIQRCPHFWLHTKWQTKQVQNCRGISSCQP